MWHDPFMYVTMTHLCMRHDSSIYMPWPMYVCDTTHLYMCHDPFMYVTRLIYICIMMHLCMWHDSSIYVPWPIYVCDTTHLYMCYVPFMYLTRLIYICVMTHSCMWHDSSIYVPWPIYVCDTTHPYAWHDPSIHVPWLIHIREITHPQAKALCYGRWPGGSNFSRENAKSQKVSDWDFSHKTSRKSSIRHALLSKLYFFSCPVPFLFICHTNWHFDFLLSFPSRFALEIKKK